jgi:hypothetical protein
VIKPDSLKGGNLVRQDVVPSILTNDTNGFESEGFLSTNLFYLGIKTTIANNANKTKISNIIGLGFK